jgi:hypothetical protein
MEKTNKKALEEIIKVATPHPNTDNPSNFHVKN